jgi:hypothetical protein
MAETVAFAFRRRYSLPPDDPRFLDATPEAILIDYWAHRHIDDPKLREEIEDEDFDAQLAADDARDAAAAGDPADDEKWETVAEDR